MALAPQKGVGLAQKALEALGQDRPALDAVGRSLGTDIRVSASLIKGIQLILWRNRAAEGDVVVVVWCRSIDPVQVNGAAVIHDHGQARGLEPNKVHLSHQPGEEGEHLVKGKSADAVRYVRLVNGAVAPAQVERLLKGAGAFVVIPYSVRVRVVKDPVLLAMEPLEYGHVADSATRGGVAGQVILFVDDDRDPLEGKEQVQVVVPDHELVAPGGDVRNRKVAVFVGGSGVNSRADSYRHIIKTDPGSGVAETRAVIKRVIRGSRKVLVYDRAGDCGPAACRNNVERLDKADEHVKARRAELCEKGRLIGLYPGVDDFGAFDGGGLLPARALGRHGLDPVLAGRQVLDGDPAAGTGDQRIKS